MVTSVREIRNIFTSSSTNTIPTQDSILPTVYQANNIGMDILKGQSPDNYNKVRGRMLLHISHISRDTSMSSTISSKTYHKRMTWNNTMIVDNDNNNKDVSPKLFYETSQEKAICLSMVAEKQANMLPIGGNLVHDSNSQCVPKKHPISIPIQGPTMQNDESTFINILLPYNSNTPTDPEIWGGSFHPISLYGSIKHIVSNAKNIKDSLKFMAKYISNKQVNSAKANKLDDFKGIGEVVWNFISSIYDANWDALVTDNNSTSLRRKIIAKFIPRIQPVSQRSTKENNKPALASIERILLPIPAKSLKKVNIISKFFKNNKMDNSTLSKAKSYTQASKQKTSTSDVIKIKETFLSIGAKKIDQIDNIVNGSSKPKPYIQMTTKGPSRKQVIIPMGNDNIVKFMKNSLIHVTNLNRNFQNVKSEVLIDFIRSDLLRITVVANKVLLPSDLLIIENYIKNLENIDFSQVNTPCLLQSKSYLKIIGISYYFHGNMQDRLSLQDVELVIKQNQIFNNITLASKSRVIKVSPKSDMAIIWVDIWDVQSGVKAKGLINWCFNIGRYIATIRAANATPEIPQCKNCWRWSHMTFLCRIQGSKYIKYNRPHKLENHCKFGWYCKTNKKTNLPCLKTKKGKLCPHSFKCSNCQGKHQANSTICPFWKNHFNREWHQKKYSKICKNRVKSICSTGNGNPQQ